MQPKPPLTGPVSSPYERGVDLRFRLSGQYAGCAGHHARRPEEARARIRLLLSIQCADGSARSVYYPATGQSEGGGRSDDHLWSVLSVCNYIRETGRLDFLKERIPYVDGGEATVLEHLEQGIRFTMAHLGRHGIPDMLKSDWDDSLAPMNRGGTGGAESVFVFFQLAHAAWELLELYRFAGLSDRKPYMEQVYAHCKSKLDLLWDGEWFIRAFTPEGKKYCTHEDTCNKIHLIPQAWSILSRLADAQRADLAMDKVMEYLYTENGLITHYPASEGFSPADKSYFLFPAGARKTAASSSTPTPGSSSPTPCWAGERMPSAAMKAVCLPGETTGRKSVSPSPTSIPKPCWRPLIPGPAPASTPG